MLEDFYDVIPYKYRVTEDLEFHTGLRPASTVGNDLTAISRSGLLYISSGYAWDGPSGPTVDTESTMEASLVHDALYQLMREGHLPDVWRRRADKELYRIMRRNGAGWFRAQYFYWAVRLFGGAHIKQSEKESET